MKLTVTVEHGHGWKASMRKKRQTPSAISTGVETTQRQDIYQLAGSVDAVISSTVAAVRGPALADLQRKVFKDKVMITVFGTNYQPPDVCRICHPITQGQGPWRWFLAAANSQVLHETMRNNPCNSCTLGKKVRKNDQRFLCSVYFQCFVCLPNCQ